MPTEPLERRGMDRKLAFEPRSFHSLDRPLPLLAGVVLLIAGMACNAPLLTGEAMTVEEALAVEPVDRRQEVLEEMGAPDAFTITFQQIEGQTVRWEEWSYHEFDSRFDFVDGELLWAVELEPVPDGSIYAHFYDPRDFHASMTTAEARQLLADQELVQVDLAEGDIPGGLLLAGDQILLGFENDRLVYVQTLILTPEEAPSG